MSIRVLSTHAVMEVLQGLAPEFERNSGVTLSVSYDPANVLKRRIDGGEPFDVTIVTCAVLDDFTKRGIIRADSRTDLGRSGLGVSVRKGAPKPEIRTVEDFKRAMLAAQSIVRSKDGTSGIYFEKLLEKLGIADAMRGKVVLGPSGRVATVVAKGDVELAVQQVSELLPVNGADFVGPLPEEVQLYTMFSAGIATSSKAPDDGQKLLCALAAPAARALFKAKGLEPPAGG
jgi:molybdate transport system substrate-binding protein